MKYILKTSKYALIISSNLHINSVFTVCLCSTAHCGGGGGGWGDLHSYCEAAPWWTQQSNGKFNVTDWLNYLRWEVCGDCSNIVSFFFPHSWSHFFPIFFQSTVSKSQCVKAGTEEKLVLHLLHSFCMGDSSFITIFLSTYRSFTTTGRVLDILSDR